MSIFEELSKPFPPNKVSWRAQDKAKTRWLAYIDARDVMQRLDDVVGPFCWQDKYVETPSGRVICSITISVPDTDEFYGYGNQVTKSDGAGDTKVEGEKGAISGAFKRAAVKWGIGRYLYDLPVVQSPQEGKEILLRQYNVMPEEEALRWFALLDAADTISGEGCQAFYDEWKALNQDEQMGLSPWISKIYPGAVSKTKQHMRDVIAVGRSI